MEFPSALLAVLVWVALVGKGDLVFAPLDSSPSLWSLRRVPSPLGSSREMRQQEQGRGCEGCLCTRGGFWKTVSLFPLW